MTDDPIAEVLESLRLKLAGVEREADRITDAIAALEALSAEGIRVAQVVARRPPTRSVPSARLSVKQMMLNLLYEQDRDWSVNEILAEYESRGTPITAKDPNNALRAAVAEANKTGDIVRTAQGRYKAAEPPSDDSVPLDPSEGLGFVAGGHHPESEGALG